MKSIEEAVEWVRRCPDPMPGEESEIEIRPVFEAEDFGAEFTPELRAQEERLRAEMEQQGRLVTRRWCRRKGSTLLCPLPVGERATPNVQHG